MMRRAGGARGRRDERRPDDKRDERDERQAGDPRDERDERKPGDRWNGRAWHWLAARPISVALILAGLISVVGYARMNQIVESNERVRFEDCQQRNEAWDRTMGYVLTISDDDEAVERLRLLGLVEC